jgi:23S rRNA pseudouridine1911/1915/1917 synthase
MPRTRVKELLRQGKITVNGVSITQFNHRLQPDDRVAIVSKKAGHSELERAGLSILHLDDDLLVVDKPVGLLTVASPGERSRTAFALILAYLSREKMGRPYVVHRLDRETSGLLIFARSTAVRDRLQSGWPAVTKTYLGIVEGIPEPPEGQVRSYLTEGPDLRMRSGAARTDSKLAVTHYKVASARGRWALLELGLETGRKHQLRVHMKSLGCPIIGDNAYGAATNPANRLGLHAWRLEFDHPTTGKRLTIESPMPRVLEQIVR